MTSEDVIRLTVTCGHRAFEVNADVIRLTAEEDHVEAIGFTMEVTARCRECDEPFVFMGLPSGSLANEPTVSVNGQEARLPFRPVSAPEGFGRDLPGFRIRGLGPLAPPPNLDST